MRAVLICLCVLAAVATFASQQFDKWNKAGRPAIMTASAKPAAPAPQTSASGRTVTLQSDRLGHFQVDARVDGRAVDFMVDTGASVIALRESSAAKLGIHPARREYTAKASTANGVIAAAPVMLNRVEVNDITVRDVQAFVMPDEGLSTNLLGMSFLSRVKWTHDRGRLVLEQ
jgi:aspartyl protease family protein